MIRHIVIDGIDRNACCGTQVPDLSHCGFIHIIPPSTASTATKPSSSVPTKLYFTAGPRAIKYLQQASRNLSLAAQAIGVGRENLVERSAKNEEQRRDLILKEKELKSELAKEVAISAIDKVNPVVWIQQTHKETHDFDFLSAVASQFTILEEVDGLIVVTSTPSGTTPSLLLVQGRRHEVAKEFYERIRGVLEEGEKGRVKGGGAKGRYMSKIEGKWGEDDVARIECVLGEVRCRAFKTCGAGC